MTATDDVAAFVGSHDEEIVALLREMLAIDSVTGNESDFARSCVDWLKQHEIAAELVPCLGRHNANRRDRLGRRPRW